MTPDDYSAELGAAMESGFEEDSNTGRHCHGLADAYMASLPENVEGREQYDHWVRRSLETETGMSRGDVVSAFHYKRVKAVRIALEIASRRGETLNSWEF